MDNEWNENYHIDREYSKHPCYLVGLDARGRMFGLKYIDDYDDNERKATTDINASSVG